MRIAGIDPGLVTTGYGVMEIHESEVSLLEAGIIHTGSPENRLEIRLASLYDGMIEVLTQFHPEALALEELYSHYEHPTTAILMGHARGVICLAAAKSNMPVFSYASTQIKLCLTGNGRATKQAMQQAIQMRLKLKQMPTPHDVADALAIAICHYTMSSSGLLAATQARQPTQ